MRLITYYRFSTDQQSTGTSIARQRADCCAYALTKGWGEPSAELIDEGLSAWSGANREVGALAKFEDEARIGQHFGDILLVERLDRLSRQGFETTFDLIRALTSNGVSIATVEDAEFFAANQPLDFMQVMKTLMKTELAKEESAKKSQRIRRRYEIRRDEAKASGKVLTRMLPAWLRRGKDGRAEIIPGRDLVIKRIFELADEGLGSLAIARKINAEFEPWTALDGRRAGQWNRTRISRIMVARQVTGEFQPMTTVDGKRVPAGEPWIDHFPAIIDHELFDRVSAAATARQSPAGRRSTVVANLFAGLLKCRLCGGPMFFERKRAAGTPYHGGRYRVKHDECQLRCANAHQGGNCANRATVAYFGFERAMLDSCLHLAMDDRTFVRGEELADLNRIIAEKRRAHDIAVKSAEALWAAYSETQSKMAMKQATDAEQRAEAVSAELKGLEAQARKAAGEADAEAHLSRVAEFRRYLYDDDLDVRKIHRIKVAAGFRSIVLQVTFDEHRRAVVEFIGELRILHIQRGKVLFNADLDKRSRVATKRLNAGEAARVRAYQSRNRANDRA